MTATIRLRPASAEDMTLLFEWVNDPEVRDMARNRDAIDIEGHRAWLRARIADRNCEIWIAEAEAGPVGQIRLDRSDESAEIDISVAAAARGSGYGRAMLQALEALEPRRLWPDLRRLTATARRGNAASLALFEGAGYTLTDEDASYVHFAKTIADG